MAEPFVFHFKRDQRGFPNLMTVADVKGECGLCGHDEIQRFYRAVPFHSMTTERLVELAESVPGWTGYECANCGTEVGPEHVVASAFVWGFADDSGLVRLFGTGDDARIQLVPDRRLDPQELPGFEPPADQGVEVDSLSEDAVEAELGRPFNIKLAIREFVAETSRDDAPSWAPLGRGMWIAHNADPASFAPEANVSCVALAEPPADLATIPDPVAMPGRIETWMGTPLPAVVTDGELAIWVDLEAIAEVVSRSFTVARLEFDAEDRGVGNICTPREQTYPHSLDYLAIAQRAAYTGISPGEAGRLTAEEVVGLLLNVDKRR